MQPYPIKHYDRPQHLAPDSLAAYYDRPYLKTARAATAAVLAGLLSFPGTAFAATEVGVDGETYTEAWGDGSTWSWDGADNMELNGYNGSGINAVGDLTIDLYGDNFISADGSNYGVRVDEGNLTITGENGDGGLYIDTENTGSGDFGIGDSGGNVTIKGADVTINTDSCAIHTNTGDVTIENGSNVTANTSDYAAIHAGLDGSGDVNIKDSTVNATCSDPEGNAIIAGQKADWDPESAPVNVNISNSSVSATGGQHAIYSQGGMNLENSDITASTATDGLEAEKDKSQTAETDEKDESLEAESDESLTSQAEAGSSTGAAIAAQEPIRFSSTNFNGMGLTDQSDGEIHYLGYADGGAAQTVVASHTGSASKFVNGVGREQTNGASPIPRTDTSHDTAVPATNDGATGTGAGIAGVAAARLAPTGGNRLASTGGNVASAFTQLATAVTSDPTSFVAAGSAFASGIGAIVAGIVRKKRF